MALPEFLCHPTLGPLIKFTSPDGLTVKEICIDDNGDLVLDGEIIPSGAASVFGSEYQSHEDLSEKVESGTAYAQASRWTTAVVPAGTYMLSVWFEGRSASAAKDCKMRIQRDDAETLWEHLQIGPNSYSNFHMDVEVTLSNAAHNFDIDFARVDTNADAMIRQIHYKLWRIS